MPKHQPFTYIDPTYTTLIACPHCGGTARHVQRAPLKDVITHSETRTFECSDCEKQTEVVVAG